MSQWLNYLIYTIIRARPLQFADFHKRLAYSPSFGASGISEALESKYKNLLLEIKYLSCREKSGVDDIERVSGLKAKWTLDPTLILEKNEWDTISESTPKLKLPEKYILVYLFEGIPNWAQKEILRESQRRKAEIVEIPMSVKQICNDIRKEYEPIGPAEFVRLVKGSECVFTNSYHGLMFSLIFKKDFYIISRDAKGHWAQFENRLTDILTEINCINRFLSSDNTSLDTNIDYKMVYEILDDRISDSSGYLKDALAETCSN